MPNSMQGLPQAIVRFRGRIALAWLVLCLLLVPLAARVEDRLEVAARIRGSESAEVDAALATRFESPFAHHALLVITGLPSADTPAGREPLREVVTAVAAVPGVTRTFSRLDVADPLFRGASGGTYVVVGLDPGRGRVDALIPPLRAATAGAAARLQPRFPRCALRWTGEATLNFDLRRASTSETRAAERRTLPLTLALLLLAFGAVAASALPLLAGGLAILLTLGAAALLTEIWPLSITLESVVSMLGLGLGIDYALLTVSRFREALGAGADPERAAEEAARHAGGTVTLSGAAVGIGFLGLMLVPLDEIRSVAVGGLLVVTTSVLLATTLLPGLLAWLGPRVDAGRLRLPQPRVSLGAWTRWGNWVAAHPVLVLGVAGLPVALLALQARRLTTELPRGDWLPQGLESTIALHDLQAMGRSSVVQELPVLLELPEDVGALDAQGWAAARRLADALAADPRVDRVRSLRTFADDRGDDLAYVSLMPGFMKHAFLSSEGDTALLEVIPREGIEPAELSHLVRELRRADVPRLTGLAGARLRVGGLPAFNADYEDAVAGRFPVVVGLVVAGTFLALFAGFRSVLVALKAVALNLASVVAAFGAVVLVFQEGHAGAVLGLSGPTGAVFPAVPILVFCIVFGLSMDYEVFLVARVAEARRRGRDEAGAIAEGLARTGGVITSAAAIMVVVFGAFARGDLLLVKMLGFALAVAVLLDATVIRIAVGPALLRLAGRWNWWPGEAGQVGSAEPAALREAHPGPA